MKRWSIYLTTGHRPVILLLPLILLILSASACTPLEYKPTEADLRYLSVGSASFSPSEDIIVMSLHSHAYRGIFLVDYRGKVKKWLCGHAEAKIYATGPVFSPDGLTIAFRSNRDKKEGDVYLMDNEGRNVRRLTSDHLRNREPRFSPDGRRIYFMRAKWFGSTSSNYPRDFHENDIFFIELDEGREYQLTRHNYFLVFDYCLLQGDRIVVSTSHYLEKCQILWEIDIHQFQIQRRFNIDMSHFASFLNHHLGRCRSGSTFLDVTKMVSSINGRYLAFAWGRPDPVRPDVDIPQNIYVTDMETMQTRRATNFQWTWPAPRAISDDGQRILFATSPINEVPGPIKPSNLWMMDHPDAEPRRLTLDFTEVMRQRPVNY